MENGDEQEFRLAYAQLLPLPWARPRRRFSRGASPPRGRRLVGVAVGHWYDPDFVGNLERQPIIKPEPEPPGCGCKMRHIKPFMLVLGALMVALMSNHHWACSEYFFVKRGWPQPGQARRVPRSLVLSTYTRHTPRVCYLSSRVPH